MWLLYSLSSIGLYNVSNFIDKYVIESRVKNPISLTIFGGIFAFLIGTLIGTIRGFTRITLLDFFYISLAGILLDLYLIPYFSALMEDDTSLVVPLFQTYPVFVLILSAIFLKEVLFPKQVIGFIVIFLSSFTLGVDVISGKTFKPRKSLYLMLLASFLVALSGVFFKLVATNLDFWSAFSYESIGMGIGVFVMLFITSFRRAFLNEFAGITKSTFSILILNEFINIFAQLLLNYAYFLTAIALVSVTSGFAPLFLLIYGIVLTKFFPSIIKEDITKQTIIKKFVLFILLLIGIILIYI